MKTKITLIVLSLLLCSSSFGQMKQYDYKREITGIKDQWHKIVLPNDIFGKISSDLSDIRIFGLTDNQDTIETPYVLKVASEKAVQKEVVFRLINQSKNDKGYYFTFETPTENQVNQMELQFSQQNFDWRLTLEGSHNQQEWFTITEDYRILSIKNELTDYQFTKVMFPGSGYRYLRLQIESDKKPGLITAKLSLNETIGGNFRNYLIKQTKIEEDKQSKQTIINIDMESAVPVCDLKISVKDTIDYYRPVTIQYLTDSVETQQGWKYNYRTLTAGTLNSIDNNEFRFNSTILQKLKITIENMDNEPLHIDSFAVKGYIHELVVRFNNPATYYLTYGYDRATKPNYDIDHFADNIPTILTTLNLSDEQLVEKDTGKKTFPLFQNKIWLWTIMLLIICLLGWFSISMIRK